MILIKTETGWAFEFEKMEAFLLASALNQLLDDYATDPGELRRMRRGPYRRAITSHKEGARQMGEEQELLEDAETLWRGEREATLKQWMSTHRPGESWELTLTEDELETFLNVLNDRRLHLAARHNFSVQELDAPPEDMPDEHIRAALWEIHYLAMFQETVLRLLQEGEEGFEQEDSQQE
ncbi:MAG: DUF2017 family protein [Verrucomicrobiota bacterium]